MTKCPKCTKEVYFAEKTTSLGKDWHKLCLKCVRCGKLLTPGGHAEEAKLEPIREVPLGHTVEAIKFCSERSRRQEWCRDPVILEAMPNKTQERSPESSNSHMNSLLQF